MYTLFYGLHQTPPHVTTLRDVNHATTSNVNLLVEDRRSKRELIGHFGETNPECSKVVRRAASLALLPLKITNSTSHFRLAQVGELAAAKSFRVIDAQQ